MNQSKSLPTDHTGLGKARSAIHLELLELFVLTADMGSIAAASRSLATSSSLATRKLAKLESLLGVRLFQRTTRSMELTEAGGIALQWARQVLQSCNTVADDLETLSGAPAGQIRLVANHYAATMYLPDLLARFGAQYPDIRVSISSTDTLVNLVEGRYDLAIHSGRIPDSSLVGLKVRDFERVVCASPAYLARRGRPRTPEDLAHHDCLVHATLEPDHWCFRKSRRLIAQPIAARMDADSHAVLLQLALRDSGIVRLGYNMVRDDLAAGRLTALLSDYKSVYPSGEPPGLWVLYPNRKVLRRTRLLIDFLVASL